MDEVPPPGALVRWTQGLAEGIGVVQASDSNGRRISVVFDSGREQAFAWPNDAIERVRFSPGTLVRTAAGQTGVVGPCAEQMAVFSYEFSPSDGGPITTILEYGLREAVITDTAALARDGIWGAPSKFDVRLAATRLLFSHKHDELSSLSNSRVEIKPHQVGVVHRVTSQYPHRYLLADEVGLGKTIEAGLVIQELKARGMANRVLVLAPAGIVSQWQVELKTKFSQVFSLYRRDTVAYLKANHPEENIWTVHDRVITSTSFATASNDRMMEIVLAGWDVVIIDEAHHARRTRKDQHTSTTTILYRLAEDLADPQMGGAQSLLLLTATPMQLDPYELYSLIELLDPALFPTFGEFVKHSDSIAGLNRAVDSVHRWTSLNTEQQESAWEGLRGWLSGTEGSYRSALESAVGRSAAISELESQHRLSEIMIRNRKSVIGGFMPRVAQVWEVMMSPAERTAYEHVTEYVRTGYAASLATRNNALGFVMTTFQKMNSSSTYAIKQALLRRIERLESKIVTQATSKVEDDELEETPIEDALSDFLGLPSTNDVVDEVHKLVALVRQLEAILENGIDSKAAKLLNGLAEIMTEDDDPKVIIFTQSRDTQDYVARVIGPPWTVHVFHGSLKPDEKDKAISRFRLDGGPQILVSTEAGAEGKNLQFCHRLINYDLPWNPMKVEQRIGRVDRIGQKSPVTIINLVVTDTIEERVLNVLTSRIKIFEQTVGGLDPILGEVETDLKKLFLEAHEAQEAALRRFEEQLESRVEAARRSEERLGDLIMDTRSFRRDEVQRLLQDRGTPDNRAMASLIISILRMLEVEVDDDPEIDGVLQLRLGDPFFGRFPQFEPEGALRRVTFDPTVAMDSETIDFFAFGHPIVDALVAYVQDDSFSGRTTTRKLPTHLASRDTGWLLVYVLELEGGVGKEELFPVFVSDSGSLSENVGSELLDEACLCDETPELIVVLSSSAKDGFDDALSSAEDVALRRLILLREEVLTASKARIEHEAKLLTRYYDYRQAAATRKLADAESTLERLTISDDPQVRRIIPVWEKNVLNATRLSSQLQQERDERQAALIARDQISAQRRLVAVSYMTE